MAERSTYPVPTRRPRRKRDPEGTREAILDAARVMLAQDGKEGVSVAKVAQRAGVNRGTTYQHFQTREQLIEATAAWVSEKLYRAVFGDPAVAHDEPVGSVNIEALTEHMAQFAMDNPDLGRIWLFQLLSTQQSVNDPFWRRYVSNFERFAQSEFAQPGIDAEVVSVLMLTGAFLWPVRARAQTGKERQQMAKRLAREILRVSLHGTMKPEKYAELDARLSKERPMGESTR
jgi:AcrR family transcriptional regulator